MFESVQTSMATAMYFLVLLNLFPFAAENKYNQYINRIQ